MGNMTRKRTYEWNDPLETSEKARNMSGFDFLNTVLNVNGPSISSPIERTLDFYLLTLEKGKVVYTFEPQEFHFNPIGTVHGGVITTLLDSAMGCTIHSTLEKGKAYHTIELKVNFLKAVTRKSGPLLATGKIIHLGRSTGLVEADLTDQEGKVYAHGVSTCMIITI